MLRDSDGKRAKARTAAAALRLCAHLPWSSCSGGSAREERSARPRAALLDGIEGARARAAHRARGHGRRTRAEKTGHARHEACTRSLRPPQGRVPVRPRGAQASGSSGVSASAADAVAAEGPAGTTADPWAPPSLVFDDRARGSQRHFVDAGARHVSPTATYVRSFEGKRGRRPRTHPCERLYFSRSWSGRIGPPPRSGGASAAAIGAVLPAFYRGRLSR